MSATRSPLDLIAASAPDWLEEGRRDATSLAGRAVVPVPGGALDFVVGVRISASRGGVRVGEWETQRLPAFCPERHVNEGATFCLGYRIEGSIATHDDAVVWWGLLRRFLSLQRVAERTGAWPSGHSIAHGDAGVHHVAARGFAAGLGILGAYDEGLIAGNHWACDGTIRSTGDGARLLNGRAPCPMACPRRRRPRLRRECCRKDEVLKLVRCDAARRKAEHAFWKGLKARGVACCGTLRSCPLVGDDPARVASTDGRVPEGR